MYVELPPAPSTPPQASDNSQLLENHGEAVELAQKIRETIQRELPAGASGYPIGSQDNRYDYGDSEGDSDSGDDDYDSEE